MAIPIDTAAVKSSPQETIAAFRASLEGASAVDRAVSAVSALVVRACAALPETDPSVVGLRADLRRFRVEVGPWAKAVRDARARRERAEAEERRRRLDDDARPGEDGESFAMRRIQRDLQRNKQDKPIGNHANLSLVLANDPRWQGVIAYHAFRESPWSQAPPPWASDDMPEGGAKPGEWSEADTTRLASWLGRTWELDAKTSMIGEAVLAQSFRRVIDPVREYLRGLPPWDGVARLDTWTIRHLGADDTEYARAVSSRWMIAAVARALRPGCKVDCALIFEGITGKGKSSAVRALCADASWFAETDHEGTKDDAQALRGKWIFELGELSALAKSDVRRLKAFMTREVDTYRGSYERRTRDYPRRCIFIGTTNDDEYLIDTTGNRRWQPLRLSRDTDRQTVIDGITAERDQLWAEALDRYDADMPWHIDTKELAELCAAEAEQRRKADPWEHAIEKQLRDARDLLHVGGEWCKCADCAGVTIPALLTGLGIEAGKQTQSDADRVRSVLGLFKWRSGRGGKQVRVDSAAFMCGRTRAFRPPERGLPAEPSSSVAQESPADGSMLVVDRPAQYDLAPLDGAHVGDADDPAEDFDRGS